MNARKRIIHVLFVVLVPPLLGLLVWSLVVQPLKYRYLIWRVESARSSTEELAAFRVAADWGRVWEANRLRPEDAVADGRQMDALAGASTLPTAAR